MRHTLLTLSILLTAMAAQAAPVTEAEARSNVWQFLNSKGKQKIKGARSLTLAHTIYKGGESQADGSPMLYVFNVNGDQGFVVASADDIALPILAYGNEGGFSQGEIPDNVRAWLQGYADQIAAGQACGTSLQRVAQPSQSPWKCESQTKARAINANARRYIWPLLTTYWDQGFPYNLQCVFDGTECLTGCVATAMAQLLYYWATVGNDGQTFRGGCTSIIGYANNDFDVPPLDAIDSFDWDNMRTDYMDSEEGNVGEAEAAVAQLMRYCGQAANMFYGTYESGALDSDAADALFCHFHCFSNLQLIHNDDMSDAEWENLIYNELANGRPVYMSGWGTDGHAFVCDGYDSEENTFHFNWGWGGGSDGYYAMNALILGKMIIGDEVLYTDDFSNHKSAIINVNPLDSEPEPTRYVVLSDDSTTMTVYYDSEYGVRKEHLLSLFEVNYMDWHLKKNMTLKIDKSFADYHPTDVDWFNYYNCEVSEIVGLQYFNTDRLTDMSYMFSGANVTSLDVSSFDTSNVKDMSSMFSNCEYLECLDLHTFDTSNVNNMSKMFSGCDSFESLDLSSFDTSNVKDVSEMFWGCRNLESLDLSPLDFSSVTCSNEMFDYCPRLNFIGIPATAANLADDAFIHVGSSEPCLISAPDDFDFGVDTSGDSFMWKGGCFKLYRPSHILLGDVNHDGEVTIVDVTLMVNYTLTHGGENFYFENADMNHDNVVTVTDINKVVDLILKTNVMP